MPIRKSRKGASSNSRKRKSNVNHRGESQHIREQHLSPRFRFESGSYGGMGNFMPSIACLEQVTPNKWEYHFVLVKPDRQHDDENVASEEARRDLEAAYSYKQQVGSDYALAEQLRAKGYVNVTGFNIVPKANRE